MTSRSAARWVACAISIASLPTIEALAPPAHAAPGPVVGTIEGIAYDGDQAFLWGWACQQGEPRAIRVDIYVDRSAYDTPRGTGVVTGAAYFDSEPAVNHACRDDSGHGHRFFIALPSDAARKGVAGKLWAHGIRLSGAFPNAPVAGSGTPIRRLDTLPTPFPPANLPPPAGTYHPLASHPRVFTTATELKEMASRINRPESYSMRRFAGLTVQINKDLAAKVDWEATYSGCDVDIYLHAFSYEPRAGYASENRSEAQLSTAMHVRAGLSAPAGAALVASRLALYAALVKARAKAPPGAPSADEAAALAKRILLAWAAKGMRDPAGRVISLADLRCPDAAKSFTGLNDSAGTDIALQFGRGVIYSVDAQDLAASLGVFSGAEEKQLDAFHLAMFDLIRRASNKGQGNTHPMCEHFANGQAAALASLLAVARLVDDQQRLRAVLVGNDRLVPVLLPWVRFFDGAIYGESDQPLPCYPNNPNGPFTTEVVGAFTTAVVAAGEIQDRYRGGVLQTFGYPMGNLAGLIDAAEILRIAGFDPYAYRGRHHQSIEMALQYYACYAKTPGFYKKVDRDNAAACPNNAQYEAKIVNGVELNMVFGAYRYLTTRPSRPSRPPRRRP